MKMYKRRLSSLITITLALSATALQAKAAEVPSRFEFRGSGYGHGVGMSQFGAYGQAREGKSGPEIATYYYPGTSVETVDDSSFVRVNIADKVATVGFSVEAASGSAQPMRIYSGDLPPELATDEQTFVEVPIGGEVIFSALSGTMIISILDPITKEATTLPSGTIWTLRWSGTNAYPGDQNIIKMRQGSVIRRYKYGQVQIKFIPPVSPAIQGSIIATTTLRIHSEYLRGIGEVPSSWPSAALEAQVITARSFALSKASIYRKSCDCNLYSTVQDQNFVGYSKESEPIYGQKWVDAITATEPEPGRGLAITYNGKVVTTYYASSTGGVTQDVAEVWGTPIPYLVPVPDPWSLDPLINPTFSSWVRQVKQADMAKAFALPDVFRYEVTARTKAGGVKAVVAYSSNGKSAELNGEKFRSRLQLPSTWISRSVNRVIGESSDSIAIAVARNMFPTARSAVLVNFDKDPSGAFVGMAYGNKLQLPVLNVSAKDLSSETVKELTRRKISSVVLIGRTSALPSRTALAKRKLKEVRFEGRNEIELSENVLERLSGEPIILIASERNVMLADASRIIASDRPILWSKDYEPSSKVEALLVERNVPGIFYGDIPSYRFPSRVVITRSATSAFIASTWQSPIVIADGTEIERTLEIIREFPNIAAITVMDKDLTLEPFQNFS